MVNRIIKSLHKDEESRVRAIVDTVLDGIITIDDTGIIETFNPAAEHLFGYIAAEVIGHNVNCLMPSPYQKEHDEYITNYLTSGDAKVIGVGREVVGQRKDGSTFPMELAVSEMQVAGQRMFTGIVRDISERKKAESELKDRESRVRAIVDTVLDGIITIDDTGIIETFNPAAEHLFGYIAAEVIGHNINCLMPSPYQKEHDEYITNYLTSGDAKVIGVGREVVGQRKDGSTFPMELAVSEMQVAGRRMFTGIVRDISERKKAMETILNSNTELERFAYVASHDLQEPLRMVINFTNLLSKNHRSQLNDDAQRYLNFANSSALRMKELVEDLLEYARLTETVEQFELVNLQTTLDYVQKNIQQIIAETKAHIESTKLPVVKGNPVRLSRLFQNLISNAIKYRRNDKTPFIKISVASKAEYWQFSFEDNGIGMKAEYCQQIFLPFKRLHTKEKYAGTGIGLSISKKIVEQLGGDIWVQSNPNQGSIFYFTLPKAK